MEKRKRKSETKGEEPEDRESTSGCHQTRLAARRERTWLAWSRSGARGAAAMRVRSFHHGGSWTRTISESKKFIFVFFVSVSACVCVCVSLSVSVSVSACLIVCVCGH